MATNRVLTDAVIPPGEILQEELEVRGMSQRALAAKTGRPMQMISELCRGKKALTADTALDLERALDIPAHVWVVLEGEYRTALARKRRKATGTG